MLMQTRIMSPVIFADWEYEYNDYYYRRTSYETKFDGVKKACKNFGMGTTVAYRSIRTKNHRTVRK